MILGVEKSKISRPKSPKTKYGLQNQMYSSIGNFIKMKNFLQIKKRAQKRNLGSNTSMVVFFDRIFYKNEDKI
jgi:hypothetical protein